MVTLSCMAAALVAVIVVAVFRKRALSRTHDPMKKVFGRHEFVLFDKHLEAVARDELLRGESELARYVTGNAGYVVVVSRADGGAALELSDGRRLALRGISRGVVEVLDRRARTDLLRPLRFAKEPLTCRLVFRGPNGGELLVQARSASLAG